MSKPAIEVHNLSKQYRIGAREKNKTFREALMDIAAHPFRMIRSFGHSSNREEDSIWALKDVSFEVQSGEVLGIVGRQNTTLAKCSKIYLDPYIPGMARREFEWDVELGSPTRRTE